MSQERKSETVPYGIDVTQMHTGVYQKYNRQVDLDWIVDEEMYGDAINIAFEDALADHDCKEWGCEDGTDHAAFTEGFESDNATYLLGDWVEATPEDDFGFHDYKPNEQGKHGYAAISREDVIQVVWSKWKKCFRSMCSPCYPNQVDADSGEVEADKGYWAYTLPDEALYEEENNGAD